ncbi:MAG: NINE protein [Treponema sp.]|nr:NINE protein [Treponema sp.]
MENDSETTIIDEEKSPVQRRNLLAIVCFFLGMLGVHRFMVGKWKSGLLQLFTFGGFYVWWIADFIMILTGKFTDKDGIALKKKIDRYKEEHPVAEEDIERSYDDIGLVKWLLLIELPWFLLFLGIIFIVLTELIPSRPTVLGDIGMVMLIVGFIAILATIRFKRRVRAAKGLDKTKNAFTWFVSYIGKVTLGSVCFVLYPVFVVLKFLAPIAWIFIRPNMHSELFGGDSRKQKTKYLWVCDFCQTKVEMEGYEYDSPKNASNMCPVNGSHRWINYGKIGETNYQCSNCGLTVQLQSWPRTNNWSCRGSGSHAWRKLN